MCIIATNNYIFDDSDPYFNPLVKKSSKHPSQTEKSLEGKQCEAQAKDILTTGLKYHSKAP